VAIDDIRGDTALCLHHFTFGPCITSLSSAGATCSQCAHAQTVNWSLRVSQPATNQFLNSSRIAVQPQGQEIAVYKNSRWSDSAPILVRNRLIQAFRSDGRIRAVSSDDDSLQADVELSGDLSAFQGVYHVGSSEVLIRFDARLVRISDRRIIATRQFDIRQPIKGNEMNEVVQAFGLASDQLATQVLNWTMQQSPAQG
jgi:cholesterol transport system auxiliary component